MRFLHYVNDVKLYIGIVNDVDVSTLQEAINFLFMWADKWHLSLRFVFTFS